MRSRSQESLARWLGAAVVSTWAACTPATARSGDTDAPALDTVTVIATAFSGSSAASAGDVGQEQIVATALLRPAAVLEHVPGLIVTQHSGEGKANQYFLRGFNLDHGTDLAVQVDGMPVNMPSHAHGQGYADLNFLIPELAADLQYEKGAHSAREGDFATVGTARIGLVNSVPTFLNLGAGENGFRRTLLGGSFPLARGELLTVGELYHNDGPFAVPDAYRRVNGVLRYHFGDSRDDFSITAMAYNGRWNATDQVPASAIDDGAVDRFGSLNPTDGGTTERASLSFNRLVRTERAQEQLSAYLIRYRLDLWSTFTYYLRDPVNGDQMLQHDDRVVYGARGSKRWFTDLGSLQLANLIGAEVRVDDIRDVAIFPTVQRRVLGTRQDASVTESRGAVYVENSTTWRRWLRTTAGLRADRFNFDVKDKMLNTDGTCDIRSDPLGCNTGTRRASLLSPKLDIVLGPWKGATYFVNAGEGYHSNDARGVTRSGANTAAAAVTPLTRAKSAEVGMTGLLLPHWESSLAVFTLKLQSELTFSGDAGLTTANGATTRSGVEWSNTVRLGNWLSSDFNTAFTRARFDHRSVPDDLGCGDAAPTHPCRQAISVSGRYVPNSSSGVVEAGVTARSPAGWFGSVRARHIGEAPLVADNSARSPAYTTVDTQVGFQSTRPWLFAVDIFNIANVKWNDIEYYYVSRLRDQSAPVADYVVHPGVPRTVRARLEYRF